MSARVVGIVGRSGSGKTTLIEALLPRLRARGLTVSTVKHTHHSVDIDPPGKDSRRHRDAGAQEVLLVSERRWALMRETPSVPTPLPELLARLAPVDIVLVEGFGRTLGMRLELVRADVAVRSGKRPLFLDDPGIDAVASDSDMPEWRGTLLDLNDPDAICVWIAALAHPSDHPLLS
ncbi:MAG: molybdopterin-guanine dinucleotide biosynthesis protein B [Janthinobacterium lividum]